EIQNFTHPIMTEPPELLGFLSVNFPHSYSLSKSVIPLMHMFNVICPLDMETQTLKKLLLTMGREMRRLGVCASDLSLSFLPGVSAPLISVTTSGYVKQNKNKQAVKPDDPVLIVGKPLLELSIRISFEKPELTEQKGGNPRHLKNSYNKLSTVEAIKLLIEFEAKSISLVGDEGIVKAAKKISSEHKVGLMINVDEIPWDEVGLELVKSVNGDPTSTTSYGSLLAIVSKEIKDKVIASLSSKKIIVSEIGKVVEGVGVWKKNNGPLTQHKDAYSLLSQNRTFIIP
ncbi:MAG: AIR synthase-related protein, partial [Thermoproteota archaeon]